MKTLSLVCFPDATAPGGGSFTLTVNGTGFVSGSMVNWSGSTLTTSFVSNSQLTATVPAANIATASTASVTVINPTPGGGTSNVDYFETRPPFGAVSFGQEAFGAGNFPYSIVAADVNRDGKLDVVAGALGDLAVSVLLGNGDGTFGSSVQYPAGGGPFALVTGDFNGDDNLDLAAAVESSDGTRGYISLLLGDGTGAFQLSSQVNVGPFPNELAEGDFNGDGNLDIAVAFSTGSFAEVLILLGNGDGTSQTPVGYGPLAAANGVAIGDLNNDGDLDVAVAAGRGVDILLGNGDGTFQSPVNYATGENSYSVLTGDFNQDGILDLAVQTVPGFTGETSILLGNGNGTFQAAVNYVTQSNSSKIVQSDLNGDGLLDLATVGEFTGLVEVFLGNNNGTFRNGGYFVTGNRPLSIASGDFNGDGMLDLITANETDNTVTILPQTSSVLSQTVLDFGSVKIGKGKVLKVKLTNMGTASLTFSGISVTGTYAPDFMQHNNCGNSLVAGASCIIGVTFRPQTHAIMTAAVTITDSAVPGSEAITLQGFGVK